MIAVMGSFEECWSAARRINGWLTAPEGRFLYEAARRVPSGGRIVEIGSFFGRSTLCLAFGSRAGNAPEILSIDPHIGSPKHAHLLQCPDTYPYLLGNLRHAGVRDLVTPVKASSIEAATDVAGPIDLVFVDGSHEHEDVTNDIETWFPRLEHGGTIAFHDSWHMAGVRRVTGRLLLHSRRVANPRLIDTITALRKTDENRRAQRICNRLFLAGRLLRGAAGFLRLTYLGTRLEPASAQPGAPGTGSQRRR